MEITCSTPSDLGIERFGSRHVGKNATRINCGIFPREAGIGPGIQIQQRYQSSLDKLSGVSQSMAAAVSPPPSSRISVKDRPAAAGAPVTKKRLRRASAAAAPTMAAARTQEHNQSAGEQKLGLLAQTLGFLDHESQNAGDARDDVGLVMGRIASTSAPAIEEKTAESDEIWLRMREEARRDAEAEPSLASYLYSTILAHRSLERALAFHLGNKLASSTLLSTHLFTMMVDAFMEDASIREAVRADIAAVRDRDPACISYSHCMLNFKGFLAIQAHRVSHRLWNQGRLMLALAIQSRVSEVFHVDIHPAARIGKGVLFDHATGLVVGETATIGNNVSILHNVTLGGTGAAGGDRHPKVGDGVLIGAGAIILGNVTIGEGAKIGAGSVVLIEVPPHTTAVGNPARLVGTRKGEPSKLRETPSETMDHTSFIANWSDYVI